MRRFLRSVGIFYFLSSPFEDLSERSVVEKLRRMDVDDNDDDDERLLTLSRRSRPILEHKLVSSSMRTIKARYAATSDSYEEHWWLSMVTSLWRARYRSSVSFKCMASIPHENTWSIISSVNGANAMDNRFDVCRGVSRSRHL